MNNNIWYTGDWKQQNNKEIPYNGVQIRARANYTPVTSPPSSQKLDSVDLEVVDFTKNPEGVSSSIVIYKTGVWFDIPIPENNTVSPPQPNTDFTVMGIDYTGLGKLQLEATTTGIFLNIQFRYGIQSRSREELGFIMKISEVYNEGEDPIKVSG
ncbi:hypothetical protein [Aquimarina muelleri]|nr:hypothetical protein [Aquimarina muelleri]MCX2763687.1 hypothetical protein [Aquimarina muelleri]